MDRRSLLRNLGVGSVLGAVHQTLGNTAHGRSREPASAFDPWDNLDCGVASGFPNEDSVTLWTRIPGYGRQADVASQVEVFLQLSRSQNFEPHNIIAISEHVALQARDYTLSVRVGGLEPESVYYYRFTTPYGYDSIIGRTRTLPVPGHAVDECSFAVLSCQNYAHGYYHVYDDLCRHNFDFIVHLGDFIYENGRSALGFPTVRPDPVNQGQTVVTLEQYRQKYKLYLSDPKLKRARAMFPWIFIWDDHEVVNDYQGSVPQFAERKALAYQVYDEYMPIRTPLIQHPEYGPHIQNYQKIAYGDLASFVVTDLRQYRRTKNANDHHQLAVPHFQADQILGTQQRLWLQQELPAISSTWSVLLNPVLFMPLRFYEVVAKAAMMFAGKDKQNFLDLAETYNNDAWDGYPVARNWYAELLQQTPNALLLTGDIHNFYASNIFLEAGNKQSPSVAVELVTSSVTSSSVFDKLKVDITGVATPILKGGNPGLQYVDYRYHGYTQAKMTHDGIQATFRSVDFVHKLDYLAQDLHQVRVLPDPIRLV